jgi:valyl-tRNA synthetase
MQLFIRVGPNETSQSANAAIKHRDTMFPPHDSKFAFRPPAVHRSHHPTVVSTAFSFPEEEQKVLNFWREIDAFQTSLKLSEGRPVYSFYDGPPFATGLPHYGHLLAGTIKVLDLLI